MIYSDVSCHIENTFEKLVELEINKMVHINWVGIITITINGKIVMDGEINYSNVDENLVVNLLQKKIDKLYILEDGTICKFNKNGRNIDMIITPIRAQEKYKVFFICCSLDKSYTERDLTIMKFVTKASYENVLLDNEVIQEKNYLQHLFNSAQTFIIGIDIDGKITTANRGVFEILGCDPKKIIGKRYENFVSKKEKNEIQRVIIDVINRNKSYNGQEKIFSSSIHGKIFINVTIAPVNNNKEEVVGVVIIGTDITKRKIYEKEIEQLRHFAVIGELAAGVAHDIKNPLMSIRGCARILEKSLSHQSKYKEFIEPIIYEVDRINETIEQMLAYAFITKEENDALLNINEMLEKCINVISFHKESKYINIEKNFTGNLSFIKGNNVQLQQAFINILFNAVQAIEAEGIIQIETHNIGEENKILVSISDNGMGISKEKIKQIFEPFNTTKIGGTGLGLSIVKHVIEKHGGKVLVSSQINEGTDFKVYLPY